MHALLEMHLFQPSAADITLGLQVVLIGIVTVFSVLCLIWGVLTLFGLFFGRKKPAAEKTDNVAAPAPTTPTTGPDEGEIIAVIAAAIAMAESESSGVKFRVVSFNKK